jgi:hypothetical protein
MTQKPPAGAGRPASAFVVWLAAACAGLSCGSPAPSNGHPVTSRLITATNGGTAATPNGKLKVTIPPGALQRDTSITIQQIDSPGSGSIGPVYEIGPTGTLFQRPVTLAFSFSGLSLGGADPTTLHVATYAGGTWVPVTSQVDRASSLVTGQITHLSQWTLIVYTSSVLPPEPDASTGGDMDGGADAPSGAGGEGGADGGAKDAAAGSGGGKGGSGGGGSTGAAGSGQGGSGAAGTSGAAGSSAGSGGATGGSGGVAGGSGGAAGDSSQGGSGGAAGDTGQGGAGGSGGDTGQGGAAGQDDAGTADGDQDSAFA